MRIFFSREHNVRSSQDPAIMTQAKGRCWASQLPHNNFFLHFFPGFNLRYHLCWRMLFWNDKFPNKQREIDNMEKLWRKYYLGVQSQTQCSQYWKRGDENKYFWGFHEDVVSSNSLKIYIPNNVWLSHTKGITCPDWILCIIGTWYDVRTLYEHWHFVFYKDIAELILLCCIYFMRIFGLEIRCVLGVKMVEEEDSELTSFHGQTRTTTVYKTTISENKMKTCRNDFTQLRI